MGTFIIRPQHLVSGGGTFDNTTGGYPTSNYAGWITDTIGASIITCVNSQAESPYFFQAVVFTDVSTPNGFTDTLRFDFSGNSIYLDGSSSPISFAGLPAGFTPTAATVKVDPSANIQLYPGNVAEFFLQQDNGNNGTSLSTTYAYSPAPSTLDLYNNGCGIHVVLVTNDVDDVSAAGSFFNLHIEGTYIIAGSSWFLNPGLPAPIPTNPPSLSTSTDPFLQTRHYKYLDVNPGPPWILGDPDLTFDTIGLFNTDGTVTSITSDQQYGGCAGAVVILYGTGFGDGASVTFGGDAATGVIVYNDTVLTCVAPAHAAALVDIVITNDDGTSATLTDGFDYSTPYWEHDDIVVIDPGTINQETFTFQTFVQSCTAPADSFFFALTDPALIAKWWVLPKVGWYILQPTSPGPGWSSSAPPPDPNGWYISDSEFGGSIIILGNGRPKDPRSWPQLLPFATGSAGMLGGSPAAAVTYENHIVYPSSDYVVGSTAPRLRIFDGSFDHELAQLPATSSGTQPFAVMSMLAANGTIYLSSLDSGSSSSNWTGRVFELDIFSGALTQLGSLGQTVVAPLVSAFPAGEVPYALTWHNGRLWCGTNKGDGTVANVYWFRPDIDTSWTLDHASTSALAPPSQLFVNQAGTLGSTTYTYEVTALNALGETIPSAPANTLNGGATTLDNNNFNIPTWSVVNGATSYNVYRTVGGATQGKIANTVGTPTGAFLFINDTGLAASGSAPVTNTTGSGGGVDSMISFQGSLYVGLDSVSGTFAQLIVRDSTGLYTTSDTGSGGSATKNNGFLALEEFNSNLYATYWNQDSPAIAKVRKFDGLTWTTAYSASSSNIRPFISMFTDSGQLFVIGGGCSLTGALLTTLDGVTWTSLTAELPEASKTLLPIYGVEVL